MARGNAVHALQTDSYVTNVCCGDDFSGLGCDGVLCAALL